MINSKTSLNSLNKIETLISFYKNNKFLKIIKKYLSVLLIPIFIIYIISALNRSEVNIFNYQTFQFTFIFLFVSLLISPIFILSKSLIFNSLKQLLGVRSFFKSSLKAVLLASSLDVFTPAKVNDFARLKGEENKKFALFAIFIERLLDISTLSTFIFFSKYIFFIIIFFINLFLLSNFLYISKNPNKTLFNNLKLISGSILITISHWLIAFKFFKTSFEVVLSSLNFSDVSNLIDIINIKKFSLVTILGVIPISLGGIGIREASAIKIFDKLDPSVVFTSAIIYGLAVSGSISLVGIVFINLKDKKFFKI